MAPSCPGCFAEAQARAAGVIDPTQVVMIDGEPRVVGDAWAPPDDNPPLPGPEPRAVKDALPIVTCGDLLRRYPERRPAVIEGLLRVGETMNIIASPKVGKSWLALGLAFAVATGRLWLNTFATIKGDVLLIDNELHPETSAHRLRTLAQALKWHLADITDAVHIVNLRGRLQDLHGLGAGLLKIERGRYELAVIDAFYRTMPAGTDENSNATMAELYNALDHIAEATGAAFALIHHASKGDQSAKNVTDVGAGAGSQSRAADTHVILRPHEEDNAVVLDAAVRSWPPVDPLCLRWQFPTWTPAPELDPTALRKPASRRRKPEDENPFKNPPEPPWTAKRFAETFGKPEAQARGVLLEKAQLAGLSDRKAKDLLTRAVECGELFAWKEGGAASRTLIATVKPPDPAPEPPAAPGEATPAAPEEAAPSAPEEAKPVKKKRPPKRPRKRRK